MKRVLLVLAIAMLALPATALAKGPSEARITGAGLSKAIVIKGTETEGSPIMELADVTGFFPAAFGQTPDPMTSTPPNGNLGQKYSIDYVVPDGEGTNFKLHQDAYPYATPNSVTYMRPGQAIFGMGTKGGWFVDSRLKGVLVAHGLPKSAADATSSKSSSAGFFSTGKLGVLLLVLFVLGGAFVLMRRRSGGVTA